MISVLCFSMEATASSFFLTEEPGISGGRISRLMSKLAMFRRRSFMMVPSSFQTRSTAGQAYPSETSPARHTPDGLSGNPSPRTLVRTDVPSTPECHPSSWPARFPRDKIPNSFSCRVPATSPLRREHRRSQRLPDTRVDNQSLPALTGVRAFSPPQAIKKVSEATINPDKSHRAARLLDMVCRRMVNLLPCGKAGQAGTEKTTEELLLGRRGHFINDVSDGIPSITIKALSRRP